MKKVKLLIRFGTVSSVIDMMRYDQAFPASEDDSRKLEKAQIGGGARTPLDHVVKFFAVAAAAPNRGRWESFGCEVLAVGEKDVNREYDKLVAAYEQRPRPSEALTIQEARRLRDEAGAMTVREIRNLNKRYFGSEWVRSADKKTIVRGFTKSLEQFLKEIRAW